MNDNDKTRTIVSVLLERMEKRRLPRLMDIRDKLNKREKLDKYDIEFLEKVFDDTQENEHYLNDASEDLKTIFMKVISLYKEITEKALALENEKDQ